MNERFLEAVGPIVVKEVRQGLRARVFAISFGLLLLACLVTSLVAAAEVREWDVQALGPQYLSLFLGGLSLVCFFVIPYTAYRSMAREREDETWVLLALTGLSSRRIVRGKVASALTQAGLYASAGAPFVLFSYFLNGVDLPTLLIEIGFAGCWAVFVTSVAVALGTEGHTRMGRAATHFLVLGLLAAATLGGIVFGANLAREGAQWLNEESFVIFACAFPVVLLTTAALVLEGAAAGLALASDATVKGARLVFVAQLLLALMGTYLGASLATPAHRDLPVVASILSAIFVAAFGFFSVSERDGFPRSQPARTWLTAGALRGWKLTMLVLVAGAFAWAGLHQLLPPGGRNFDRTLYAIFAAPLYVGLYLSLAVVIGRLTPMRRLGEPVATRLSFLVLVLAAAVLFPVAAVLAGERANDRGWNLLNPIFGMVNYADRLNLSQAKAGIAMLAGGWAVSAILAWVVLKRRDGARIS
ncbi:MAG: transporter, permease protein [Myxococcaceae bacterium]|nr:transporter, permease protein [Myxococcaceae bacterium]